MNKYFAPYLARIWDPTDINEHLPILFTMGLQCQSIVEFGVRSGCSTTAFLAALKMQSRITRLYSYDINDCSKAIRKEDDMTDSNTIWSFVQADTSELRSIPECDLLFIDTLHTYDQVVAEVEHHKNVRRWMVFHDTILFGSNGERGQRGILPAIMTFLERNPEWKQRYQYRHNNGLMILERK